MEGERESHFLLQGWQSIFQPHKSSFIVHWEMNGEDWRHVFEGNDFGKIPAEGAVSPRQVIDRMERVHLVQDNGDLVIELRCQLGGE